MLSPPYSVFFDIYQHSLPLAENFPKHKGCRLAVVVLSDAAKGCRLAVVVLSDEFVLSKWPMIELCTFVNASVHILPLFYKLSPSDIKQQHNLQQWRAAWEVYAEHDPQRIDLSKWEQALNRLSSFNGLTFDPFEGELAYLQKIVSSVCKVVPPTIQHEDSGLHGKDRLCKIILAKFAELERLTQEPNFILNVPSQSGVCVLGMYGLPGSGKSTLSRCVCDCLFHDFAGKALYLQLPTNPTLEQLISKSKELLNKLTDFRDRIDLTNELELRQVPEIYSFDELELRQVYSLLRSSNLQSSKVFLVVDNISSQESMDMVQGILSWGLGAGSKVLLVARTTDILRPLLHHFERKWRHYVCDSIRVPSMNEKEAVQVLLQSGGGVGLVEFYAPEDCSTSTHQEILEKVVRMSGFFEGGLLYLPLVLKIMGDQLREYELDVQKWGSEMDSFWRKVQVCKENAVKQLVQESFEKLSKELQLLFLDVALFIVPSACGMKEACAILSFMHESIPERIEKEVLNLQRRGYLMNLQRCGYLMENDIHVHDVFLEFAASIPESSRYYLRTRHNQRRLGNEDAEISYTWELSSPLDQAKASALRAIFLELDEGCEKFNFSASLSSVRALVLRNSESLTVLGLGGLTSSLVSLEIENCPRLRRVELAAGCGGQLNQLSGCLKRLKWVKKQDEIQAVQQARRSIWMQTNEQLSWVYRMSTNWLRMMSLGWHPQGALIEVGGLASLLTGLQVLTLENTGIRRLGDMSKCCPQLQELNVFEQHLQHFELGSLPRLRQFHFDDRESHFGIRGEESGFRAPRLHVSYFNDGQGSYVSNEISLSGSFYSPGRDLIKGNERVLGGKDLLAGCPKLEEVRICSDSFQEGLGPVVGTHSNLHTLLVTNFSHSAKLPDLAAALPQSLNRLLVSQCMDLRSVDFHVYRLEHLTRLKLMDCPRLVEVSGLEGLPSLRELQIEWCFNLRILNGLSGLVSLETFTVGDACPNLRVFLCELENLARLKWIECQSHYFGSFECNMTNLVNLEYLKIGGMGGPEESLGNNSDPEVDFRDLAMLAGGPLTRKSRLSNLQSISHLALKGLRSLASLNGIEFLLPLKHLTLRDLQNLTCLKGIEFLINLREFKLKRCGSVEELPSLCALVNVGTLDVRDCVKLKAVEGCDAMTKLEVAAFTGCQSLEILPFDYGTLRQLQNEYSPNIFIHGSKFASVDALLEWVVDKEVPVLLRKMSLRALYMEWRYNLFGKTMGRRELGVVIAERVVIPAVEQLVQDNSCLALLELADELEERWRRFYKIDYPCALVQLLHELATMPKEGVLEKCRSDTGFKLAVGECLDETARWELIEDCISSLCDILEY